MYFMLGTVMLEAINITDFSESQSANFAEHAVVKGKPRLQAIAENLTTAQLNVRLHHSIGGVESRYQTLLSAKSAQQPLALVWGRGKFKGYFVIQDLNATTLFTDGNGTVLAREISLNLTEYVGEMGRDVLGAALQLGSNSLFGSILPSGVVTTFSTLKQAVSRGVEIYQQAKRTVDTVRDGIAQIKAVIDDPLLALNYLPSVLGNIDSALGGLGEVSGLSSFLTTARTGLQNLTTFSAELTEVGNLFSKLKSTLNDNVGRNTQASDWITVANTQLANIDEKLNNQSLTVSQMSAWIVLRTDEPEEENHG